MTDFIERSINLSGIIFPFAGEAVPYGFLLCDGREVLRDSYKKLFISIGERYGVGDGSTTFNLPDLRQRFLLGKSAAGTGSVLGEVGGAIDHTHDVTVLAEPVPVLAGLQDVGNEGTYSTTSNNPPYQVVNFIIKI